MVAGGDRRDSTGPQGARTLQKEGDLMMKNWPRKLTVTGFGASLILWTSGLKIVEAWEPEYCNFCTATPIYDRWQWVHRFVENRYPLAAAIALTIFGAYHMYARRNSN